MAVVLEAAWERDGGACFSVTTEAEEHQQAAISCHGCLACCSQQAPAGRARALREGTGEEAPGYISTLYERK